MRRIPWNKVISAMNFIINMDKVNHRKISVKEISKRGHINYSYLHNLLDKKRHPKTITEKMVKRIGYGLGIPDWANQFNHAQESATKTYNANISNRSSVSKTAYHSSQPEHYMNPAIVFYPQRTKLSPIARQIKQIMGTKQISMKNLAKATYINKQRLHDLFNGTAQTLAILTCVRIADGLNIKPLSLLKYNHSQIVIHEKPLFKSAVQQKHKQDLIKSGKSDLVSLIGQLNTRDKQLIKSLVERLLVAEK